MWLGLAGGRWARPALGVSIGKLAGVGGLLGRSGRSAYQWVIGWALLAGLGHGRGGTVLGRVGNWAWRVAARLAASRSLGAGLAMCVSLASLALHL